MSSTADLNAGERYSEELDRYFKETQSEALLFVEREEYSEALQRLSINERVLEEAKAQSFEADVDFVISTLHNIACCHQGLNQIEDSASYLEACLYNLKAVQRPKDGTKHGNEKFKRKKYECRARIQLCALLSQLGRHEAALSHAQIGLKLAQSLLIDVLILCKEHTARHRKLLPLAQSKPFSDVARKLESSAYKQHQSLVKSTLPLLELLDLRIRSKPRPANHPTPKLEVRSALGVQHYTDWIYTFNMSELMKIQQMPLAELKSDLETYTELTRDMMLDKVCLLIAGYFCVSTEVRLLYGDDDVERLKEAQSLHMKAVLVARDVLPLEAPLLEHVQVSYQKNFAGGAGETSRSRLGKLEASMVSKSPLLTKSSHGLSSTAKPRSTSAKATRPSTRPTPQKPKSPAPKLPRKPQTPLTERNSSRKAMKERYISPGRDIKPRRVETEVNENSDEGEFVLCSSDLYGEEEGGRKYVECSVDMREWTEDGGKTTNNDYGRLMSSTGGN